MRVCAGAIESPDKGYLVCNKLHGHEPPHDGSIVHYEHVVWEDGDTEVRPRDAELCEEG